MTPITIIDRPCGFGKTTDLIAFLKDLKNRDVQEKILLVVPELGEIERYINALGVEYFKTPIVEDEWVKEGYADNKTDVLMDLLSRGDNAVILDYSLLELFPRLEVWHLFRAYLHSFINFWITSDAWRSVIQFKAVKPHISIRPPIRWCCGQCINDCLDYALYIFDLKLRL